MINTLLIAVVRWVEKGGPELHGYLTHGMVFWHTTLSARPYVGRIKQGIERGVGKNRGPVADLR